MKAVAVTKQSSGRAYDTCLTPGSSSFHPVATCVSLSMHTGAGCKMEGGRLALHNQACGRCWSSQRVHACCIPGNSPAVAHFKKAHDCRGRCTHELCTLVQAARYQVQDALCITKEVTSRAVALGCLLVGQAVPWGGAFKPWEGGRR
jgi:hypothetical protein